MHADNASSVYAVTLGHAKHEADALRAAVDATTSDVTIEERRPEVMPWNH